MPDPLLRCKFCNKPQNEVHRLIAGPDVFICDQCVEICNEILAEDRAGNPDPEIEVTRTVSLPAHCLHTGIALLAGAIRVIHFRSPRLSSTLTLDVDNLTLTLRIKTTEATRAEVEEALRAYGTVLQGRSPVGEPLDGTGADGMRLQIEGVKAALRRAALDDASQEGLEKPRDPDQLLRALGWILREEIENVDELFS
jgi:hypothetical protein